MIARLQKSMRAKDQGFTLIELLVVMIIIGILAAIAIPVFLSQRAKARDTSTKADVSTVGKEIASYYVDGTGTLSAAATAAGVSVQLVDSATPAATFAPILVSNGTKLVQLIYPVTTPVTPVSTGWCVEMTNADGSTKTYKYSGTGGLQAGTC